jgi:cephalosporin-C deacetylase-like acetyl esterase
MSQEAAAPITTRPTIEVANAAVTTVTLDGTGKDPVWANVERTRGLRFDFGRPENPLHATRVQVVRAGQWLLFGLDADESEDIVARESTHGTDLWFDDALSVDIGDGRCLIMVNPFGTSWCSRDGKATPTPIVNKDVRSAARIENGRWRAEIAVKIPLILTDPAQQREITAKFIRQRQQRGWTPFEEPSLPTLLRLAEAAPATAEVVVNVAPMQRFVEPPVLTVTRVTDIPSSDEAWSQVAPTALSDESGLLSADPDFQRTDVRAALARDVLALRIDCHEAHMDSVDAQADLWKGDQLEIFLGPEGYPYLQLASNSKDKNAAVRGKTGGRATVIMKMPEGISVSAAQSFDGWSVTVVVPFASLLADNTFPAELTYDTYPWRMQVVRNRPAREKLGQGPQTSMVAVTRSGTAHCPLRYAVLRILDTVDEAKDKLRADIDALPDTVLTAPQRRDLKADYMLQQWLFDRASVAYRTYEAEFAQIDSLEAWQQYAAKVRAKLMAAMYFAGHGELPERTPLNARIVFTHKGEGFSTQGVLLESRPGLPVMATLYLPDEDPEPGNPRPAVMMIPAHHTPRNHRDLQVFGMTTARAGGVALAIEPLGSGERTISALIEHRSYQCNVLGGQIALTGDDLLGWMAWDISRCVDYLLTRGDIDPQRLALMGGVAGGGDITAFAALADPRITVSIPFTFSERKPFDGYYDPTRTYAKAHSGGYSAWTVCALFAPKAQVLAQEFNWTESAQQALDRFTKVYRWYDAEQNLDHMFGEKDRHSTHFNELNRVPVYKILNRWWRTKLPEDRKGEYDTILKDSFLECSESADGMLYLDKLRADGRLREAHQVAAADAAVRLALARDRRERQKLDLREDLAALFHDVEPVAQSSGESRRLSDWRGWHVEGKWLSAEPSSPLGIAAWVIKPRQLGRRPLVAGFAQFGKAQFLLERAAEIEKLLKAGIAVALIDVRGCGEIAPSNSRFPEGLSVNLATIARLQDASFPVLRLKDARTALRWLAQREDVDAQRIALWGEGLTPTNGGPGAAILFDELCFRQCSPTPKHFAEPLGGWLALTTALYPIDLGDGKTVRPCAVLARGTLISLASILERRSFFVSNDFIIPNILTCADIVDVVGTLRAERVEVMVEDLRDGSNRAIDAKRMQAEWGQQALATYSPVPSDQGVSALVERLSR